MRLILVNLILLKQLNMELLKGKLFGNYNQRNPWMVIHPMPRPALLLIVSQSQLIIKLKIKKYKYWHIKYFFPFLQLIKEKKILLTLILFPFFSSKKFLLVRKYNIFHKYRNTYSTNVFTEYRRLLKVALMLQIGKSKSNFFTCF